MAKQTIRGLAKPAKKSAPSPAASENTAPPKKAEAKSASPQRTFTREFGRSKEVVSDIFKLDVAKVTKQIGAEKDIDKDPSSFVEMEHTHIFRTYDSDGKRHDRSASIGGHFHMVEWEEGEDGMPRIKSVSGPMIMSKKKVRGKVQNIAIPVNDYDTHTHTMSYIRSDKLETRSRASRNTAAAVAIAMDAPPSLPGVTER